MSIYRQESDERTVRRFEAFSDIVIGFSLAQLGVSLTIPAHGIDLYLNPEWLISFVWAFANICAMWWFHHRIFASIFVPRTIPTLLNFVWLAVVVLCVYFTEVTVHLADDPVTWRTYFALFALAYGLLAAQYYVGVRLGGTSLPPEMLLTARRQRSFMTLWTGAFTVCTLFVLLLPWGPGIGPSLSITFTLATIASALMARYYRKLRERSAAQRPSA